MNTSPILPIGTVNLKTAKNKMFGTVFECWGRNSCACLVLKKDDQFHSGPKHRVVVTSIGKGDISGPVKQYPAGHSLNLVHDQSRYDMGTYRVLEVVEYNEEGFKKIQALIGSSGVSFSTFK